MLSKQRFEDDETSMMALTIKALEWVRSSPTNCFEQIESRCDVLALEIAADDRSIPISYREQATSVSQTFGCPHEDVQVVRVERFEWFEREDFLEGQHRNQFFRLT
jgi:hypothetical protein